MSTDPTFILIIQRPIGEAPEWVRDAWIGLQVPVVQPRRKAWLTVGVVTGPRTLLGRIWAVLGGRSDKVTGYAVNARIAVDLLTETNPLQPNGGS